MPADRVRIWVLTNTPSPYQVELLAEVGGRPEVDLDVRFMSGESPQTSGLNGRGNFQRLDGRGLSTRRDEMRWHPQAIQECRDGEWDIFVLSGTYASPTLLRCASILTQRQRPWLLWGERPHPDWDKTPWSARWIARGPVRRLRNALLSRLLKRATGVLAIGQVAVEEYHRRGFPLDRIRSLPYCCRVDRFIEARPADALRRFPELANRRVLLYSGQLIERKGVRMLMQVFGQLCRLRADIALLVLGDGPLRSWMEQVAAALSAPVCFPGHVAQADLPGYFAAADVFFFPSRYDGWGVVVNEACASGLPVVTTAETGAAADLVVPGQNGFVLGCEDEAGFVRVLDRLLEDDELRRRMGEESRRIIEPYRPEVAAERFVRYVRELGGVGREINSA